MDSHEIHGAQPFTPAEAKLEKKATAILEGKGLRGHLVKSLTESLKNGTLAKLTHGPLSKVTRLAQKIGDQLLKSQLKSLEKSLRKGWQQIGNESHNDQLLQHVQKAVNKALTTGIDYIEAKHLARTLLAALPGQSSNLAANRLAAQVMNEQTAQEKDQQLLSNSQSAITKLFQSLKGDLSQKTEMLRGNSPVTIQAIKAVKEHSAVTGFRDELVRSILTPIVEQMEKQWPKDENGNAKKSSQLTLEESTKIRVLLQPAIKDLLTRLDPNHPQFPPELKTIVKQFDTAHNESVAVGRGTPFGMATFVLRALNGPIFNRHTDAAFCLTKIIQNVANCVQFGAKEQNMVPFNAVVTPSIEKFQTFYTGSPSPASGAAPSPAATAKQTPQLQETADANIVTADPRQLIHDIPDAMILLQRQKQGIGCFRPSSQDGLITLCYYAKNGQYANLRQNPGETMSNLMKRTGGEVTEVLDPKTGKTVTLYNLIVSEEELKPFDNGSKQFDQALKYYNLDDAESCIGRMIETNNQMLQNPANQDICRANYVQIGQCRDRLQMGRKYVELGYEFGRRLQSKLQRPSEGWNDPALFDTTCPTRDNTALPAKEKRVGDMHANYVDGPAGRFIAAQVTAPKPPGDQNSIREAHENFLRGSMNATDLIVDLSRPGDGVECYPDSKQKKAIYGNIAIICDSEERHPVTNATISTYRIIDSSTGIIKVKMMRRIHYPHWVDQTRIAPETMTNLVSLCNEMKSQKPPLVHCRAGVGRTGTFITAANIIAMRPNKGSLTDPEQAVTELIMQGRMVRGSNYVQKPEQLELLLEIAGEKTDYADIPAAHKKFIVNLTPNEIANMLRDSPPGTGCFRPSTQPPLISFTYKKLDGTFENFRQAPGESLSQMLKSCEKIIGGELIVFDPATKTRIPASAEIFSPPNMSDEDF